MAQEGKVTVPVKPEPWKEGDRDVPAVLGHDEGQPAYGVAVKVWREGDKLKADLVNIPKEVDDAIQAGAYFQTSAEVYDDTGEAGLPAGNGCMLRRIALLGADIPQVKTLADLPKPDGAGNLKGVEIFAVGEHRGHKYQESDLDNMVENFQRYSAPAVKFSAGQLRHKVTMVRKFASAEQTGPRGGKFHVSESGTKVYDGGDAGVHSDTNTDAGKRYTIASKPKSGGGESWHTHDTHTNKITQSYHSQEDAKKGTRQANDSHAAVDAASQPVYDKVDKASSAHASWAAARAKKVAENKPGYLLDQAKKSTTIGGGGASQASWAADGAKALAAAKQGVADKSKTQRASAYQAAKAKRLAPLQPANNPIAGIDKPTAPQHGHDDIEIVHEDGSSSFHKPTPSRVTNKTHDDDIVIDPPEKWMKHSDEVTMDRSRIIDALVMAGCDRGVCEAMDDATLQAMAPVADKLAPGSVPPDDGVQPMADDAIEPDADETQPPAADVSTPVTNEAAPDAPEFDRTSIVAQLVGAGLDANELNALSDDDLKKRLEQINAVDKNADMSGQGETPDDPATTPGPQADGSEAPIQKLACASAKKMSSKKYAEQQVSALHTQLEKAKQQIDATLAQATKDVKAAKFEAFKEKLRSSGRLVPAMEEGGLLDDFVQSLDHSTVRKFGESKKTQFEMLQDILDRLPRVVKYGETVKSSDRGVLKLAESKTADEGEEGVRTRYRQFSEKYQKMGFKEDEAVEAFKRRKAKNPLLTAADVLPA